MKIVSSYRYTGKRLEQDVAQINRQLAEIKSNYCLVVGYRYNYTALDLATLEQAKEHCCERTLECGTPKECLAKANQFLAGEALNAARQNLQTSTP